MKLTNQIRDSFVNAVMRDVPQIDHRSKAFDVAMKDAISQLPEAIKVLYDDPKNRPFVALQNVPLGESGEQWRYERAMVPGQPGVALSKNAVAAIKKLSDQDELQTEKQKELRQKIKACAYSTQSRKQLVEMLPEFEKYLPVDEAAALRTLPVVQNVVADFVKAGWPANQIVVM